MKLFKTSLATSLLIASSQALALGHQANMTVDFTLNPSEGNYPCEITNALAFSFGEIEREGMFFQDIELTIQCDDSNTPFDILVDKSPTTTGTRGDIYSNDYYRVYLGTKFQTSADGTIFARGYRNSAGDACIKNSYHLNWSPSINVGGVNIYPVGGDTKYNTYLNNRNVCMKRDNVSETGEYSITMTAILMLDDMPPEEEIDDQITSFSVPVTLISTMDMTEDV